MCILAEIHQEPDLKLNLKFEIEVLCKNLQVDLKVRRILFFILYYYQFICYYILLNMKCSISSKFFINY